MSTNNSRLQYLVSKYLNDTCTAEELAEFWRLIGDVKDETPMQVALQDLWQQSKAGNDTPAMGWAQVLQTIYDKASPALTEQAEIIPLRKRPVIRWTAAAVIVLSLGAAAYWLFNNNRAGSTGVVATTTIQDVQAPKNNRATITLANGKTVYLDSAANGSLATQSNVQLIKLADGQIAYKGAASELVYNTLTNPMGSKVIDMTLSDGSRIWLNAGSSITYPVTFVQHERNVEISGEVYFEVAHNAEKPFRVRHGAMEVQVLGTHFNINAYEDEDAIRTTLLEGSVSVKSAIGNRQSATDKEFAVVLKPGEQAVLASHSPLTIHHSPDLAQVMAWKNGLFSFTGADLTTVMRQLARWYNIQVKYEGQIPARKFSGEITHDLTLSQLMNGLQSLGIQFSIEGRTMIIKQK